jgi:hypothetical protein
MHREQLDTITGMLGRQLPKVEQMLWRRQHSSQHDQA